MFSSAQTALILAPHTDDGEFGCGGVMTYLLEQNVKVYSMAFSICEESVPKGLPTDQLEKEFRKASQVIGIDPEHVIVKHYPVRRFLEHRQDILEDIVKVRNSIKPDWVFMPSSKSIHQDHKVIFEEGLRAFKFSSCLGYDLPWDYLEFTNNFLIQLEQRHVQKKVAALKAYKSQTFRFYANEPFIFGLARTRGVQAQSEFAEAFEVIKLIIKL